MFGIMEFVHLQTMDMVLEYYELFVLFVHGLQFYHSLMMIHDQHGFFFYEILLLILVHVISCLSAPPLIQTYYSDISSTSPKCSTRLIVLRVISVSGIILDELIFVVNPNVLIILCCFFGRPIKLLFNVTFKFAIASSSLI